MLKHLYHPKNVMPQGGAGAQTVLSFLRGLTTESPYQSLLALRAKSSVLYEWASRVAASWDPHSPGAHTQLQALDARIDQFTRTLPPLDNIETAHPSRARGLLVVYSLCYCATLRLNAPKDNPLNVNTSKTVIAANAVADVLQFISVGRLHFVDPIMGILWGLAGQVLIASLVSIRNNTTSTISPTLAVCPEEIIIIASLTRVLDAMFALKDASPLIDEELTKLRSSMTENQAGVL
ncbi:hypothetical protein NM688_g7609 [Phlebia brevispora]|uniref:Uncharacterized protein n=1 Tax=Phlebia brevispora TaxID=194682 RepID=A0ACC1S3B6_9APHY|nr:hypothetical protein NM688_g7609 [Phlebia brevispora]